MNIKDWLRNNFPYFNLDNILKIYEQKRRKLAFLKKFHPSKELLFSNYRGAQNVDNDMLKNYTKYSFFPHNVKQNLIAKKEQKITTNAKMKNLEGTLPMNSPFFKKKEFQKKPKSIHVLVKEMLSNKNTKRTLKN